MSQKPPKVTVKITYSVYETKGPTCNSEESKAFSMLAKTLKINLVKNLLSLELSSYASIQWLDLNSCLFLKVSSTTSILESSSCQNNQYLNVRELFWKFYFCFVRKHLALKIFVRKTFHFRQPKPKQNFYFEVSKLFRKKSSFLWHNVSHTFHASIDFRDGSVKFVQ